MNPTRLLRLHPMDPGRARWALLDREGRVEDRGDARLDALPADSGGRELVVLVPTEAVLLARVAIPAPNRQKLLQAVPYALEDQLTSDIEALHFAVGPRLADGSHTVAVVAQADMRAWLDALSSAGLTPRRMLPDATALPAAEDAWTGVVEDDRFVLGTGAGGGFAGETDNLPALLEAALAEAGDTAPAAVRIAGAGVGLHGGADLPLERDPRDPDAVFAAGLLRGGTGLELLTGPFAASGPGRARWRPWRPAAALALAWVLLDTTHLLVERVQLTRERDRLDDQVTALFRDIVPDANRVVAPRERVETVLERLRGGDASGGDDLLATLVRVGPHLRDAEALRLGGLRWRGDTLELELGVRSLQSLDELQQAIDADGALRAEIRQARSEDDEVRGRLVVRRQAS